ncbi:glycerol-3-phosphate ABC transporter [Pectobacterium betavasculorum]|uniref:Glycerol-3-phosphate ABC transporter n=1 Tax=Pectobacterium betavasculorum TaxID=55207 RepID=A0A093S104_9GAMM|nr:phosphoglycerate transporter protein PgtP [Pectobacterium betavasculorum]KFX03791.1 glycerol-3-phosphate ABC transporter [Pectobacterium betavasculorum]KFX18403.1 glycerol-3-phosphate ABC transporter [Pectobacterium betavasculorum]
MSIFTPAKHKNLLPKAEIDKEYQKIRWQVFLGTFLGYAAFYLLRKNYSLAIPYMIEDYGYTKASLGTSLTLLSIAYGISKFVMGSVSDRSNPKYFAVTGLMISAFICIVFGLVPGVMSSIPVMCVLSFMNGWAQGMGYPPYAKTMVTWFSQKERGKWWSWWNVSHNLGGGLIAPLATLGIFLFGTWHSIFFFPALIAIVIAIITFFLMRDTPQSCGLPPIEVYKKEGNGEELKQDSSGLSHKEIFVKYVLRNKFLWYIAVANIFVYFIRYGVVDWAPTYLSEVKGFSKENSRWAYFLYEWAGIPGMLVSGYLSDLAFKGKRAPATILFMCGVLAAILVYWFNPPGNPLVDNISLIAIGFLIYGPVMMIGLQAADLVPREATGSATGLTGLLGYLLGSASAGVLMGFVVDIAGWTGGFITLIASCLLAITFLLLTLKR